MNGSEERRCLVAIAAGGDRAALDALLSRYGSIVMGVCLRTLGDGAEAHEAFQAVFLVLLKRGPKLRPRTDVAVWLHGVACRVAWRALAKRRLNGGERPGPRSAEGGLDLRAWVDHEIDRLWRRAPVILCHLMGLSRQEAAARLGCSVRTVEKRLAAARGAIDARLRRRVKSAGRRTVAGFLSLDSLADASVPASTREAVIRAAARLEGDRAWDALVSSDVLELARRTVAGMILGRIKAVAAVTLLVGLTGAGVSFAALQEAGRTKADPTAGPPTTPAPQSPVVSRSVLARTERLQSNLVESARRAYLAAAQEFHEDRASLDRVHRTSRLLLDAQLDRARTDAQRRDSLAEHRDRMAEVARRVAADSHAKGDDAPIVAEADAILAEAELWLTRGGREPARTAAPVGGHGRNDAGGAAAGSAAIFAKLDMTPAMHFRTPTPLEQVLKYVRESTSGGDATALPVYVDPVALRKAGATLSSPVAIDVEGVPLRQTLQLVLRQVGLRYYVEDGLLVVSTAEPDEPATPVEASPLQMQKDKANRGELSVSEMKALAEKLRLLREIEEGHASASASRAR
ncbi:sigma-70 family RNA polymerase sigma factor [Paludisphaera mucosa]|uniref:Sigma-70 family RNA polymerase sigma factor n=1 Tax=Paludisphaera mucosa TaxID=3030827 RepID=A0ABT6FG27_9BACT|nr:sigma-70 family RNA polymerase sigma factor [Paludisphaera mucosa]MDG3006519.1 sigma-70 family RNA polymerase sigma factor [Paludisphaera mucosa]